MAISTAIAIYFLIWWIVLFAVLPWGVRAQGEGGAPGTDPGAPRVPRLKAKLVWTTLVVGARSFAAILRCASMSYRAGDARRSRGAAADCRRPSPRRSKQKIEQGQCPAPKLLKS